MMMAVGISGACARVAVPWRMPSMAVGVRLPGLRVLVVV